MDCAHHVSKAISKVVIRDRELRVTTTTQEVEKLIQKDRLKDAVKQAKLLFKEDNTPENHQLLERAYFLRHGSFSSSACRIPRSRWPGTCSNSG